MTGDEIKDAVRKRYASIAASADSCCKSACGCSTDDSQLASIMPDESSADVRSAIVATADLGLGCGTPVDHAELREGMTVLDLGSGAGIDVFLSAQKVGPTGKAIGIDMTDKMLERANANKRKLGITNAQFRKGEIERLPVDSESVDRIISNCVINLVPDKANAFSEMYRVLKSGGKFVVSDIVSIGEIPADVREDMERWAGCVAGALEKENYLDIVRKAGFAQLEIVSEKSFQLDPSGQFGLESMTLKGTK
jgi:SAM-dependent methyltransferase